MKQERIIEELARIEGTYNPHTGRVCIIEPTGEDDRVTVFEGSLYLHPTKGYSHMYRIITGMDDDVYRGYKHYRGARNGNRATPAQMAEAALRAYGKYQQEAEDER